MNSNLRNASPALRQRRGAYGPAIEWEELPSLADSLTRRLVNLSARHGGDFQAVQRIPHRVGRHHAGCTGPAAGVGAVHRVAEWSGHARAARARRVPPLLRLIARFAPPARDRSMRGPLEASTDLTAVEQVFDGAVSAGLSCAEGRDESIASSTRVLPSCSSSRARCRAMSPSCERWPWVRSRSSSHTTSISVPSVLALTTRGRSRRAMVVRSSLTTRSRQSRASSTGSLGRGGGRRAIIAMRCRTAGKGRRSEGVCGVGRAGAEVGHRHRFGWRRIEFEVNACSGGNSNGIRADEVLACGGAFHGTRFDRRNRARQRFRSSLADRCRHRGFAYRCVDRRGFDDLRHRQMFGRGLDGLGADRLAPRLTQPTTQRQASGSAGAQSAGASAAVADGSARTLGITALKIRRRSTAPQAASRHRQERCTSGRARARPGPGPRVRGLRRPACPIANASDPPGFPSPRRSAGAGTSAGGGAGVGLWRVQGRDIDEAQTDQILKVARRRASLVAEHQHFAQRAAPIDEEQQRAMALSQTARAAAQLLLAQRGLDRRNGGEHLGQACRRDAVPALEKTALQSLYGTAPSRMRPFHAIDGADFTAFTPHRSHPPQARGCLS